MGLVGLVVAIVGILGAQVVHEAAGSLTVLEIAATAVAYTGLMLGLIGLAWYVAMGYSRAEGLVRPTIRPPKWAKGMPASSLCPVCGWELAWIPSEGRWSCPVCEAYL